MVTRLKTLDENWEMSVGLPLDVVGSQLRRIEEQLRILDMKAFDAGRETEPSTIRGQIDARLEQISESLSSIVALIDDIDRDMRVDKSRRFDSDD
jgi:hypothetical protein